MMYGMRKRTLYAPKDLKATPPKPRLPLFRSRKPRLSERVGKALAGFGKR